VESFDSSAFTFSSEQPKPVNVSVGQRDGSVVMVFNRGISWLQMSAESAIEVGEMIKEKGIEILRSQPGK